MRAPPDGSGEMDDEQTTGSDDAGASARAASGPPAADERRVGDAPPAADERRVGDAPPAVDERTAEDARWMARCIDLAREAAARGDHPFGSVIVRDGRALAEAGNRVVTDVDPTAHAETAAIRAACRALGTRDLSGATLYASGEPCWMCSAVIRDVRIARVVIGEPSRWTTGGYTSDFPILRREAPERWAAPPAVTLGVLADRCAALLDEAGWGWPRRP
jgi:tRNA(adenine34) deaminase